VVVGIKSTEGSADLLRTAFRIAADRHARLVVLHAWKLPYGYDEVINTRSDQQEWADRAQRLIERGVASLSHAHADVSVEVRVVHGQAAVVLQSASRDADLLLVARRGHAFPLGHLGGVGRALLRESLCPVEIVPAADEPSAATDIVIERDGAMQR
jgi:nucleotide-binding universal stress UspA family protein